ncbi:MAG TPA: TetR family transcriptional regulator [Acidimicrobiales bacterium]|nr:TetR family transcriptional regulator [Acidimicrobiales bacterium]
MELAPSHRERKKQATKRAIHLAAIDLVEKHGLSGATVDAISERAGVAPRTFWSYFASKEEAIVDHDPDRPEAIRLALLARPAGEHPLTALQAVLEEDAARRTVDDEERLRRFDLIRSDPHLMSSVAASFEQIERALVSAVAERTGLDPEADLYPGVVVAAACSACRVAYFRWSAKHGEASLAALIEEAFAQLAGGLAAPPRRGGTARGRR